MYKTKNKNRQKMAAPDSAPPSPALGDESLCRAPTRTGPPTRGPMEV